jgi:putative flippase GtrA
MNIKLSDFKEKKSLIQFIKFGIVGISNTILGLSIYYIFVWINKDLYQVGNVVGWLISVAWSCYWNNKFVFTQEKNGWKLLLKRLWKSYISYGVSLLLSIILLYIQIETLKWSERIAPLVNLLITIPLNFIMNKFWTFRVESEAKS